MKIVFHEEEITEMYKHKVTYIEGNYEDRLYVGGKYCGRVDIISPLEMLCLLAREGLIDLQIKTEEEVRSMLNR
ncbi:hypothetical protein D3C78_1513390 [compost metagenome]